MGNRSAYWQLGFTAAIWGASWLCGRLIAVEGVPAMWGAFGRFAFGSAALFIMVTASRQWAAVNRRTLFYLALMGLTGVVLYNVCFFNGLRTVPAGRASLVAALQPSIVFLFSVAFWSERVTLTKSIGLLLSLSGAALVLSQGDLTTLFADGLNRGDLWVLGCAVSWVAYTLLARSATAHLSALAATAYSTWIGTLLLIPLTMAAPSGPAWSGKIWLAFAFLGVLGTAVAFAMYTSGVSTIGASRASIFVNLVPVFAVLFSAIFLHEAITFATVAGGAVVIAGVRMLNSPTAVRRQAEAAETPG